MVGGPSTHRVTPDHLAGLSTRRHKPGHTPPSPCHVVVSPAGPHRNSPPLDGAGILVQPPHALQGSCVRQQVRGEAGVFQHEEHINQLFEGALGRSSQSEGLGVAQNLQPQNQARKGPLVGSGELSGQTAPSDIAVCSRNAGTVVTWLGNTRGVGSSEGGVLILFSFVDMNVHNFRAATKGPLSRSSGCKRLLKLLPFQRTHLQVC